MSAICGIVQCDRQPTAALRCAMVQAALEPYGRDAQGLWHEGPIALGSRLARLLPEDSYDQQPLVSGDGRFILIGDVRLDNRSALAEALGISASRLRSLADADVLLAAYVRWEQQSLHRLVGDFAFAVWDRQRQRLFLARDHMGRRPLFFHQGNGWFGFASMPAGLLALPEVPVAPDEERLGDLLLSLPDHSDHSYFAGIRRLLPGHSATVRFDGGFSTQRYWLPPTEERIHYDRDDDYVDAFLETLEESVRCRLRSTGGIASQISGGFDSATITSVAATLLATSGQALHAFTSVPNPTDLPSSGRLLDEGPLAAEVASLFGNVRHECLCTDDKSITTLFEQLFELYNRPAKNVINLLWDMSVAQRAAAHGATTLLTGELGNFTLSYDGRQLLNTLLREGRLSELGQQLRWQWRGRTLRGRLGVLYRMLMPSLPNSWQSILEQGLKAMNGRASLEAGVNAALLRDREWQRRIRQAGCRPNMTIMWYASRMWRQKLLLRHDFAEYGKGTLALCGVDRRDPTVDIRLIHFCQAIPEAQFNNQGVDRWLLRRALRRYWPEHLIASRVKGKQGADWQFKMKRELDALIGEVASLDNQPLAHRLLDVGALQQQLAQLGASRVDGFQALRPIAVGHFLRTAIQRSDWRAAK
ncbi:asparagine synthetase B family protein [Pseudomonas sp. LRF_L74]|uniref:asparagine synthetase B family protein n=1 Tax=Pseudomonas sp. LRF_L74 TaxID=3369422 RepID=UPI003F633DAB